MKTLLNNSPLTTNQITSLVPKTKSHYGYFFVGLAAVLIVSAIDLNCNFRTDEKPYYIANILPVPKFISAPFNALTKPLRKKQLERQEDINDVVGNPATIEDGKGATEKQKKAAAKHNNLKEMTSSLAIPKEKMTKAEKYVSLYLKYAKEEEKEYGIPVSITLAQGILESNMGQSSLAAKHNNHFGVKWRKGNKNAYVVYADDSPTDKFVKYSSVKHSFRGHSIVLQNARYKRCYKTRNYKAWALGLQKAGYATGKNYAKKLIKIIERMELYKYDFRK